MDKWTVCHRQVAVKNCTCYACRQAGIRGIQNTEIPCRLFDSLSSLLEVTKVCIRFIDFFFFHV